MYIDLEELERARIAGSGQCVDRSGRICDAANLAVVPTRAELERTAGEELRPEQRPMAAEPPTIQLFISYAHKDEELKDELMNRLKGIKRSYPIEAWEDRQILAGAPAHEEILKRLRGVDITLLLISPDFRASDYCWTREMEIALEQYEREGRIPVPIIVRETPEWDETEIGRHVALPKDGLHLLAWPNPDAFWADVERGLRRLIRQVMEQRGIAPRRS